jgi:tetratricopeptide (TPR) repeat protein
MADFLLPAGVFAALAGLFAVLAGASAGWYVMLRRGRSNPDLREVRTLLDQGDWRAALDLVQRQRPAESAPPEAWHEEQVRLEGECLYAAAEAALRAGRFGPALQQYRAAAGLIGLSESEATRRVAEAMLAEARRLVVAEPENAAVAELLKLVLDRQSPNPEATFWLGLCHIRCGDAAAGLTALKEAHEGTQSRQADTALYYGAALLRGGQPRDALRVLADANKLAPNCPLIGWQLGTSLLASGGDVLLGLRALQKATAADGLPRYLGREAQMWTETLPSGSWVRNVASQAIRRRATYRCPFGFDRLEEVLPAARLSLAEAYAAAGRTAEATNLFADLLKTTDTLAARRGLGFALTKLERFDEALPHLRIAREREQPPTPRTTGTLALCLARAAGDRAASAREALAMVAAHSVRGDAEWARLVAASFKAARDAGVTIGADEVRELANVLTSTDATDPTAAGTYDLLAGAAPDALPAEMAWLYVRAAQQHNARGTHDAALFDRAFADRERMKRFFVEREWDFDAAERLYLRRWLERSPGTYPTAPGREYAARTEALLLAEAKRLQGQGRPDNAREIAELALRLSPKSAAVYDRLAEIEYRLNDAARAIDRLQAWRKLYPNDPRPLARLAVIFARQGRHAAALRKVRQALDGTRGLARVGLLVLGARFALAAGQPDDAVPLLEECVELDSTHTPALAALAAVLWTASDRERLAQLSDPFVRATADDPWFHYLAAVTFFAAGQFDRAESAVRLASADPAVAGAAQHLLGVIRLQNQRTPAAIEALDHAVAATDAATRDHAHALRGQVAWRTGDFATAIRSWVALPEDRRHALGLDDVLSGTAFLSALTALHQNRPEEAVRGLRLAKQRGFLDPRLGPLLTTAELLAAGAVDPARALKRLEKAAGSDAAPEVLLHLARAYRLHGRFEDARKILDRLPNRDALTDVQRGLTWLGEGQPVPAEKAFADAAHHSKDNAAAVVNLLLCRLSLGRYELARELLPRAAELAPPNWKRLLGQLRQLVAEPPKAADWSAEDDRRVVQFLHGIGRFDVVETLADRLIAARPRSPIVQALRFELVPLRAKDRIDRGDAPEALRLLTPEAEQGPRLVRHLLGLAACLRQDFARAVRHWAAALPADGDDPRIQQNLALARGWQGDAGRSTGHWRRFLEHHDQLPQPPGVPKYHQRIAELVRERMRSEKAVTPRRESSSGAL